MDNKAVIYARVSSKEQEQEGYSIPAQLKLLKEYAVNKGFCVIQEYVDVETAKRAGRTNFNLMLKFLEDNPDIKTILVEKTDRLYRNFRDYVMLDDLDLAIHLVKENQILSRDSKSHDKFVHGVKVLMAKNYIDNLSEETKKGLLEKAEQGIYPFRAPVGYDNIEGKDGKKTVIIDEQTAPFIKRMFELYSSGDYSLVTLRKKILEDGFVYRNGKNFHKSTVEYILKNEFYTGVFYWKGKKYDRATHPAIVTPELFMTVQSKLRNPNKPKSRKGDILFPYTSLIKCGYCPCTLTAEIKKGKHIYYHCSQSSSNHGHGVLKEHEIEIAFSNILKRMIVTPKQQQAILQALKETHQDKIEFHNHTITQLNRQISVLQNRIDQAYTDKLDGRISNEFWQEHTKKWQSEKDELSIKLMALEKADKNYFENANLILELARNAYSRFMQQPAEEKRKLFNLIVSNGVYTAGNLEITLKKPLSSILEYQLSGNELPE